MTLWGSLQVEEADKQPRLAQSLLKLAIGSGLGRMHRMRLKHRSHWSENEHQQAIGEDVVVATRQVEPNIEIDVVVNLTSRPDSPKDRLIRFVAKDGKTYFGDAILPAAAANGIRDLSRVTHARIISGDVLSSSSHSLTQDTVEIQTLLSPLASHQTRTVRCLGLNYVKHAQETGMPIPESPVLFYKPSTALAGPRDAIPVFPVAQKGKGLDYEGELVIVIGRETRNVSKDQAEEHVLGYAVGNDVSHRDWQLKWGGGQWALGKCYDGWAPWGPAIVKKDALPSGTLQGLRIETKVNGKVKQSELLDDMIFDVPTVVSFLSQGVTLMPGDLIFTGTPAGVQVGQAEPVWLKHGDEIQVGLEGIGSIANKMNFVDSDMN